MSRLYPTLEDMKVDQMAQAQAAPPVAAPSYYGGAPHAPAAVGWNIANNHIQEGHELHSSLYPTLGQYMGMDLSTYQRPNQYQVAPAPPVSADPWGAMREAGPVTSAVGTIGMKKAEIKAGLREVTLCKDGDGMIGLRVEDINNGIFICFVQAKSPAALAGLRFGDQILQIDGNTVAGWKLSKVHDHLRKKTDPKSIKLVIRDRPFDRTITMQKDSAGRIGFVIKDGEVSDIVKESSAARNGMLTEHAVLEIDGQNVVGMKDKDIAKVIDDAPVTVTVTIMPGFIFKHMMKHMKGHLVRNKMDHSIPDV